MNQGLSDVPESHRRIFGVRPAGVNDEDYARRIFSLFAARAFRRPATKPEVDRLVGIVQKVQKGGDSFERGIQIALHAVLVSPHFLFRIELDPEPLNPRAVRTIGDYELATRLSYFLWSSTPDDELLHLAHDGTLRKEGNLAAQVRRMLKDPKSGALVENFAAQWLQLRNLKLINPDKQFTDFDDALRGDGIRDEDVLQPLSRRPQRARFSTQFRSSTNGWRKHYGISESRESNSE